MNFMVYKLYLNEDVINEGTLKKKKKGAEAII